MTRQILTLMLSTSLLLAARGSAKFHASVTEDSRALSSDDWYMINNKNNFGPSKETVLNTLMRKIYPDLRYRIQQSANL